ncbi:hypothetical protein [Nocardioides bizhenqiangii]|uniref:Uncharacterized protein n=1 Tax=Nocardioides bizhenqiangii TaxID=3095076 RepID=A0ABZ0ZQU4_9ACTN|nr:hypothetical protein [Nocardioides sp. HM61]WQQ26159.1 hypothetical protein SHK19_19625 [Nocardioides sp. HM61]
MESTDPQTAAATLAAAEQTRDRLAAEIRLPRGYEPAIGTAIAIQIATAAVGLTAGAGWGALVALAGLLGFAVVAAVQLLRFRRLNGIWLGGLASRVVLGTSPLASIAYAVALFGALGAASRDWWWLVGLLSMAGTTGYVVSGRRWLARYRIDPATHGRGETFLWLLGITAFVVAGCVLLVLES